MDVELQNSSGQKLDWNQMLDIAWKIAVVILLLGRIALSKPGTRIAIHGIRERKEFDVHAQVSERPTNIRPGQ